MKAVTLTQLKNNFSSLMDLVKKGKTSLIVYERKTPVIKIIFAGQDKSTDEEFDLVAMRLERAGLLKRAGSKPLTPGEIRKLRVTPRNKKADIVAAVLAGRDEER